VYPFKAGAGRSAPIAVRRYPGTCTAPATYIRGALRPCLRTLTTCNSYGTSQPSRSQDSSTTRSTYGRAPTRSLHFDLRAFFNVVTNGHAATGTYSRTSAPTRRSQPQPGIRGRFVTINARYTPTDGSLNEQSDTGVNALTSAVHHVQRLLTGTLPTASMTLRMNAATSYCGNIFMSGSVDSLVN
jgi:hypothetical protein